jgi:hypothetical protein
MKIVFDRLADGGTCFIETHVSNLQKGTPIFQFHPAGSLKGDHSNYFSPNLLGLTSMIEECARIQGWTPQFDLVTQYNSERAIVYVTKIVNT